MLREAAALILMVLPTTAVAAPPTPNPAMSFQLVRAASPECAPDCPEWIAAQGQIVRGTARAFRAFLAKLDARRRPVLIQSNGGSIDDALEMGRLIRARGLAVAIAHTTVTASTAVDPARTAEGSADSQFAYCLSACSLVLAAGVERYVNPLATVGVHQTKETLSRTFIYRRFLIHYRVVNGRKQELSRDMTSESRKTVASTVVSAPALNTRLAAYFREMGEDPNIVDLMQTATPEQIHDMSAKELIATRLATVWIWRRSAMILQREDSGLAGFPVETGATGHAILQAGQSWAIPPAEDGLARELRLDLAYRRGGGGVTATFAHMSLSLAAFGAGIAPGALETRTVQSDERKATYFYPTTAFCRLARSGVVFASGGPFRPPTHTDGLPDPRAKMLLVPLSAVEGVSALVAELCPAATASHG